MIGELIIGIPLLVVGIIAVYLIRKGKKCNSAFVTFCSMTVPSILILIGLMSLSQFCLELSNEAITWRNGLFIAPAILSMDYVIVKIVSWIQRKFSSKGEEQSTKDEGQPSTDEDQTTQD